MPKMPLFAQVASPTSSVVRGDFGRNEEEELGNEYVKKQK